MPVDLQHHTVKEIEVQAYLDGNLTLAGLCQQITEAESAFAELEVERDGLELGIKELENELEISRLAIETLAEENVEAKDYIDTALEYIKKALVILER